MEKQYRPELKDIPPRIAKLPTLRGYPVPWFVAEVNGQYDFRVMDGQKFVHAIRHRVCWVCGEKLGSYYAFPIGPMCAVNRTISEPPSHRECAEWSIKYCPFLNQSQYKRNEANMPEGTVVAGCPIKRQPGVICLWITKSYKPFKVPSEMVDGVKVGGGVLIQLGPPEETVWYREGRHATLEEIRESIDSGLPALVELAEKQGTMAMLQLKDQLTKALMLLPGYDKPKRNLFASAAR